MSDVRTNRGEFNSMPSFRIRPFEPNDWLIFKDFRLQALKAAPGVFATSYEEAVARSPEQWQTTICGPVHQIFGLFDGERLIAITAVFTSRDDPSGETAELAMSFILPEYRGQGLSRL